jgi:hypothetical protein
MTEGCRLQLGVVTSHDADIIPKPLPSPYARAHTHTHTHTHAHTHSKGGEQLYDAPGGPFFYSGLV